MRCFSFSRHAKEKPEIPFDAIFNTRTPLLKVRENQEFERGKARRRRKKFQTQETVQRRGRYITIGGCEMSDVVAAALLRIIIFQHILQAFPFVLIGVLTALIRLLAQRA